MSDQARLIEIKEELAELNRRKLDLIAERRRLVGVPDGRTFNVWLEPVFSIVENHPGTSRLRINVLLDAEHDQKIGVQELTNTLTTLRRRGWIENRGTRKRPRWFSRGRRPRSEWNMKASLTG